MAKTTPKSESGVKKSEGRKNLKSLREGVNKLNSIQLKNFYAGMKNLKAHQRAINNAVKAQEGKQAGKIEKEIAKLQKQLEAAKKG